jgi:hypothetical protein
MRGHQRVFLHALGRWHTMTGPGSLAFIGPPCLEPRVNFLLVLMMMLIWFLMNHHNFFTQPP